jgi:short-subunit dehydrogenase
VLPADLSLRSQTLAVAARIEDQSRPIDILVNNAGFGMHVRLVTEDYEAIDRAFAVMVEAVFILGGAAARAMKVRGSGQIINLASTASFMTMGAYSAIKAWVLSYSQGLSNELKGTGVTATALCPGWIKTEFHDRAGINPNTIPSALWVDIHQTVETAIRASERGKAVTVPSVRYAVMMFFVRHMPLRSVRWISRKISSSRHDEPATQPAAGAGKH